MMEGLEGFIQNMGGYITTNPALAVFAAFLGGVMTASNPCVLAMVPLMLGFVGGYDELKGFKKSMAFSFLFVIGIGITFTAMGIFAAAFGKLFGGVGRHWNYIIFAICLVMALHLWGFIHFGGGRLGALTSKVTCKGSLGAIVLGMLFGIVSAPCAVPVLALILAYMAKGGSMAYGGILLFAYAVGHSVLIVIAGTSFGAAQGLLASQKLAYANKVLKHIAAVLILAVGIYFVMA